MISTRNSMFISLNLSQHNIHTNNKNAQESRALSVPQFATDLAERNRSSDFLISTDPRSGWPHKYPDISFQLNRGVAGTLFSSAIVSDSKHGFTLIFPKIPSGSFHENKNVSISSSYKQPVSMYQL